MHARVYVHAQVDSRAEPPCLLWFRSYRAKRFSLSLSLSFSFTFSQSGSDGMAPIFAYRRCSPSVHNRMEFANRYFFASVQDRDILMQLAQKCHDTHTMERL